MRTDATLSHCIIWIVHCKHKQSDALYFPVTDTFFKQNHFDRHETVYTHCNKTEEKKMCIFWRQNSFWWRNGANRIIPRTELVAKLCVPFGFVRHMCQNIWWMHILNKIPMFEGIITQHTTVNDVSARVRTEKENYAEQRLIYSIHNRK